MLGAILGGVVAVALLYIGKRMAPTEWVVLVFLVLGAILVWVIFWTESRHPLFSTAFVVGVGVWLFVLSWWGIYEARRERNPWFAGTIALLLASVIISQFALFYYASGTANNWSKELRRSDALLIALGTLTTAGTDGVTAKSEYARRLLIVQMTVDIFAFTALAAVTLDVLGKRKEHT
jgi:hypothetical protein